MIDEQNLKLLQNLFKTILEEYPEVQFIIYPKREIQEELKKQK